MRGLRRRLPTGRANDIFKDLVMHTIGRHLALGIVDVRRRALRELDCLHAIVFFCHGCQGVKRRHSMDFVV